MDEKEGILDVPEWTWLNPDLYGPIRSLDASEAVPVVVAGLETVGGFKLSMLVTRLPIAFAPRAGPELRARTQ